MLPPAESAVIAAKFANLPERQFSGRPAMQRIFRRLFEIYDEPPSQLRRAILINQLLQCIFEVLDCFDHHRRRNCSQEIRRIVEMIQTYPEEEFSLEDLADEADLSVSRFKARFRTETGIGPHEFILRNKVEAAKRALLQDCQSVTNVAMRFGFSSSQYFATVFRRFTYQTPAEFRTSSGFCNIPLRDGTVW